MSHKVLIFLAVLSSVHCIKQSVLKNTETTIGNLLSELHNENVAAGKTVHENCPYCYALGVKKPTETVKQFLKTDWCTNTNKTHSGQALKILLFINKKTYSFPLDVQIIKSSNLYDPDKKLAIFIHGFRTLAINSSLVSSINREFVKEGTYNSLALDASEYLDLTVLEYGTARNWVELIGNKMAQFLVDFGVDPSSTYLVGHSLGAHIAGITGKVYYDMTNNKIDRITGLDPAGPCFSETPKNEKLSKDDAEFVDIIHCNGDVFGTMNSLGTVDFYPNGGTSQPGCSLSACSHDMAVHYYAASFQNGNFMAVHCPNKRNTFSGKCLTGETDIEVSQMGFYADRNASGIYYLSTTDEYPYGRGMHGVEILLEESIQ